MNEADLPKRPLGRLLLEKGLISEAQLAQALAEERDDERRLGEVLVARGWLSLPTLTAVLAEQHGIELGAEAGLRARLQARGDGPPPTPTS